MQHRHILIALGALVLAAAPVGPRTALASVDAVRIARLKYGGGGDWYSNPSSLPNLMRELNSRTLIEIDDAKEGRVELLDEELYSYPFVYMNGHGEVRWSQAEVERLREYLLRGGFLWADDNYGMDRSFRREIAKVFPESRLVELPYTHDLFRCFYELPEGTPKIHEHDGKPAQSLGIFHEGRLVVVYTYEADIGDGLEDPEVHQDPAAVREQAVRYAVNLVTYALSH
jgi:hypothetical protein